MPINAKFTDNDTGLIRTGNGVVADFDIMQAHSIDDDQLSKLRYWILDLTPAEKLSVTMDFMKNVADKTSGHAKVNPNLIIAVSVDQKVHHALVTLVNNLICKSALRIGIYDTLGEAKEWITKELQMDLTFN
jgi:hypothetical protein